MNNRPRQWEPVTYNGLLPAYFIPSFLSSIVFDPKPDIFTVNFSAKLQMGMVWEDPEGFREFPYGWEVSDMKYEKASAEVVRFSPIEFMLMSMGGWKCGTVLNWSESRPDFPVSYYSSCPKGVSPDDFDPEATYWYCNGFSDSYHHDFVCVCIRPYNDNHGECDLFVVEHS